MKVVIAGSRELTNPQLIIDAVKEAGFKIKEVVCGGARGIDTLGEEWAKKKGIPVKYFHAKWQVYGRIAGPVRNKLMAKYADCAIVIRLSESRGSKNMVKQMQSRDKPVFEKIIKRNKK